MADMNLLPVELLRQIFENLLVFDDWEDVPPSKIKPLFSLTADSQIALRAVSLTCHAFHEIIEPLLWRHICLGRRRCANDEDDEDDDDDERPEPTGPNGHRLLNLLRLWHSRPDDTAAHVRTISIGWPSEDRGLSEMSSGHIDLMRTIAEELGLHTFSEFWPRDTDYVAIVAGMLVLLARKVEVLDMFVDSYDFLECLQAPHATLPFRLESLQHVRLHPSTHDLTVDVDPLLNLAPNVKRFDAWHHTSWGEYGLKLDGINWTGMTCISLKNCWLSQPHLVAALKECRELQELALLPAPSRDISMTVAAIERHASTLRRLDIDFNSVGLGIGSLAKFTRLEELRLSVDDIGHGGYCVLGMLPPNLERLELMEYPDYTQDEILRFAELVRFGRYPKLQEVRLQAWDCEESCRGRYVNGDGPDSQSDDPQDDDSDCECDGGKIAMELKVLLVDAGVGCTLLTS